MHFLLVFLALVRLLNVKNRLSSESGQIYVLTFSSAGYELRARSSPQSLEGDDEIDNYGAAQRSIGLIMEKIQVERRTLIDESCRKILWRRQSRPARFYVDDRHRLMYCYVPKVHIEQLN